MQLSHQKPYDSTNENNSINKLTYEHQPVRQETVKKPTTMSYDINTVLGTIIILCQLRYSLVGHERDPLYQTQGW